jgi:hypothetical protein
MTPPFHLLKVHFNIIVPSRPRSCKWSLYIRSPRPNPVFNSPVPIRSTCPSSLILLDLITRIMFYKEQKAYSSSLCSLPQSPVTSALLASNIFLVNQQMHKYLLTLVYFLYSNTLCCPSIIIRNLVPSKLSCKKHHK